MGFLKDSLPPTPNLTPFLCKFFNLPWKPSRFLNGLDNKAKWLSRDFPSSSHNPCHEKRHFQEVGKDKLCHQHSNIVYPQSFWRIVGRNHFFHFSGKLQQFSLSSKNERSVKGGDGVNYFYEQQHYRHLLFPFDSERARKKIPFIRISFIKRSHWCPLIPYLLKLKPKLLLEL